ncbi:discoidin domain-containing protein [uncultured Algibacter sp.]|uniref:discoidin domain-containing protein n=1 Tax=uncultured Algibacter sp. TaxID=298659 RepID=UPI002617CD18|nr:discoidin domain-containing protein [uncultured Algibacter sp.]
MKTVLGFFLSFFVVGYVTAQQISVDADDYKQEFTGTGASAGLYIGHYLSLSEANRLEASRMLYEDLKLNAFKNYTRHRHEDRPDVYDNISVAIANAKLYNPNLEIMMCTNNLPDDLEISEHEHDPSIPNIMDKIAEYYFSVCEGYFDRGHTVDIIELINEKGYLSKKTDLYDMAADKFKALINDPSYNTKGVPMPKIAGPGTWSAKSPKTFINGWKNDRPNAWANVDIVTTHGYQDSREENFTETFSLSEGKPFYQSEQTGKIQTDEANGVDVLGEQFPDPTYYPPFVSDAEIAKQMIDFYNGGGNSFYCFLTNTATTAHNAGLIGTPWGGTPGKTWIYDGFKHLSATHPVGSKRVSRDFTDATNQYGDTKHKVVAFREEGTNLVYVHILNLYNTNNQINLDFKGDGIKQVKVIHTDEFLDFAEIENTTYTTPLSEVVINTTPYSVTTAMVTLEGSSTQTLQSQTITFNSINDVQDDVTDFGLTASASSTLPVSYEVLSGPATISGSTLSVTGVGVVRVRATQAGDATYYKAAPVDQIFYVRPSGPNIALNKPATASSEFSSTYTPDKAVDGNIVDNSSRWVTSSSISNFGTTPQWLEIELGANYDIDAMSFYTGLNGYNRQIYEFDFQIFNEQTNSWITVISETDNINPVYLKAFTTTRGNKVRLYMDGAPSDFIARLYELEVFGTYHSELGETLDNIALNKTVTVTGTNGATHWTNGSTNYQYLPEYAVDGNIVDADNRWVFDFGANALPVEMIIDFGEDYVIDSYNFIEGNDASEDFEFQYWDETDGQYKNLLNVTGNTSLEHGQIFPTKETTDKLKIIWTKHQDSKYIRMHEIQVFGALASGLSVNDFDKSQFQIYPNPVKGNQLHIKGRNTIESVSIYNLLGVQQKVNINSDIIDVSNLSSGLYILNINNQFRHKFIKQ